MPERRDVVVKIVAWHENYPPGILECRLQDRFGRDWRLATKQVYVTDIDLNEANNYPLPGSISCEVHSRRNDEAGREIAESNSILLRQISPRRAWTALRSGVSS